LGLPGDLSVRADGAPVKIVLERGGGFAGPLNHQRLGPVDTDDLDPQERDKVIALVQDTAVLDAARDFSGGRLTPDGMWRSIRMSDGAEERTFGWSDGSNPPVKLAELFDLVAAHGRWGRA
jgi:hypothetical protein